MIPRGPSLVAQRLMESAIIIKREILGNLVQGLTRRVIVMPIDFLLFHAPPQAFRQAMVQGPAFAIHVNAYLPI